MERDVSFLLKSPIAHRGYHDISIGIPENSIRSFREAISYNFAIELDVHILKDGKVVVFHDDNLERMTGLNKELKETTFDEIKDLKLQNTNQTIPLFSDVLKLINGRVPVIIELKYDVKCGILEKEVINLLKDYKGQYAIKSFNPFSILYFKRHYPQAIRGQLASNLENEEDMSKIRKFFMRNMLYNPITKPDFISYDITALPNKKISNLKNKKVILGWTIRSNEELEKVYNLCDNFIFENIILK